jgi:hypothetical protein
MRSLVATWFVVSCLAACGGNGRTPPTEPQTPGADAGSNEPTSPGGTDTDTGEPLGPVALATPSASGGAGGLGGSGGLAGSGGLGAHSGRDPIAR